MRIPADVDREDQLLAGLTGRQLLILAVPTIGLWAAYMATRSLLALPLFAAIAFPFAVVALTLALGRQDGLSADRLALQAIKQTRAPRRLVPGGGIPNVGRNRQSKAEPPTAELDLPAKNIDEDGVVDLGKRGFALVCEASSINFGLRNPAEQAVLVLAFARFLNSINTPIQIVIRAEQADLTETVSALRVTASGLAHPNLKAAAIEHADYLEGLASKREVLRHQVLVVITESRTADESEGTLHRKADDARAALAPAGITLKALTPNEARSVIARAMDPELTAATELAIPGDLSDQIVTRGALL